MSQARIVVLSIVCLLLLLTCGSQGGSRTPHYIINYVRGATPEEHRRGLAWIVVEAFDTRTNERHRPEMPLQGKVRQYWCNEWDTLVKTSEDTLPVTWATIPEIAALTPIAAAHVAPGASLRLSAGPTGVCYPDKNIQIVGGDVSWDPPRSAPKSLVDFIGLYWNISQKAVLVDFGEYPGNGTRNVQTKSRDFFDAKGENLYYELLGLVKRYNILTRRIDTILAGDVLIIPWNKPAIAVYSREDKRFTLLNDSLQVQAVVLGDIEGKVNTAYCVDDSVLVFASEYLYSPDTIYGGVDARQVLALYELDFASGTLRELGRNFDDIGQILEVERVE